jgi:hypothetical protein
MYTWISGLADTWRRVLLFVAAFGAAAFAVIPAAHATAYFGQLDAYEDGIHLATSSGGSVYYEGTGTGRTIAQRITFRDVAYDGNETYGEALQQAWDKITAPRCCTYYTWAWTHTDQTNRYGADYGWRTSYLRQSDPDVLYWRVESKVCVDQPLEPDACGHTSNPTFRQP